jgi:hypothetical protein
VRSARVTRHLCVRTSSTGLAGCGVCVGVAPGAGLADACGLRFRVREQSCGACAPSTGQISHFCRLGVVRRRERPLLLLLLLLLYDYYTIGSHTHTRARASHGRRTAALTRPVDGPNHTLPSSTLDP